MAGDPAIQKDSRYIRFNLRDTLFLYAMVMYVVQVDRYIYSVDHF